MENIGETGELRKTRREDVKGRDVGGGRRVRGGNDKDRDEGK